MKVAIIGAGLAGLYCAHELERLGIKPVIYEKNSYIGETINHVTGVLDISHRPIPDLIKFLKKNNHIDVQPLAPLNVLEHHSPNVTTTIRGSFGYLFKYSKDADSLKCQVYSKLRNTKVHLCEIGDYITLSQKYDYVVVANGNSSYAEESGVWQDWLRTYVRGAIILGDFDPNKLIVWINKDYCKNGYAYMTPFDRHRASIVLITTDVNEKEIDRYWELFLYGESIKNPIVEEFTLVHKSGFVYPHQLGNIIFAGNAGGGVEPFLGFGHLNATVMGAAAARTIALGWSYEKQIKDIMKRNDEMRRLRMMFNTMTNDQYDILMTGLGLPGIKQLLYSTNITVSKYGAFASRFILKKSHR
ncbi:MAG TPA: NAD(P)/FAD-dependent oxidoreductase [Clostridia bacterium]|nr:NAD(P)/FAD-dependent oxidoreductase [Clostridia bacterium]